jgi:glycosyltransferase involved in cell wall biosynthesis
MDAGSHRLGFPLHLHRALKSAQPDVVQGWMYHGNFVSSLAGRLSARQAAVAWNIRTSLDNVAQIRPSTRLLAKFSKGFSRSATRIIYNSSRSRDQHRRAGYCADSDRVIPNGFDLNLWRSGDEPRRRAREIMGVSSDSTIVGYVGRATPIKDIPTLLEAFASIVDRHPDSVLVLVGRDMEHLDISGFPAGSLKILGQRSDVPQILPGFDIHCLSSLAEGFPNVLGEAMACEVPCVTTDVGDSKDIVGDTGWVVAPGNSVAYGAALNEALSLTPSERKRMGELARRRIACRYSLGAVVEEYSKMYHEIGAQH